MATLLGKLVNAALLEGARDQHLKFASKQSKCAMCGAPVEEGQTLCDDCAKKMAEQEKLDAGYSDVEKEKTASDNVELLAQAIEYIGNYLQGGYAPPGRVKVSSQSPAQADTAEVREEPTKQGASNIEAARTVLQKIASGGCTCGAQGLPYGECAFCKLSSMVQSVQEDRANSQAGAQVGEDENGQA